MGTRNGHNIRKAELKDLLKVLGWWCIKQTNLCHCSKEMLYQKVELYPNGKYTKLLDFSTLDVKAQAKMKNKTKQQKKKPYTTKTNPNHTLQTE